MEEIDKTRQVEEPQYYRVITFKAAPDLDQRLRQSAKQQETSVSAIIRQSLLTTFAAEQATKS